MPEKKKRSGRSSQQESNATRSRNALLAEELASELDSHDRPDSPTGEAFIASVAANEPDTVVPGPSPAQMNRQHAQEQQVNTKQSAADKNDTNFETAMDMGAENTLDAQSDFGAAVSYESAVNAPEPMATNSVDLGTTAANDDNYTVSSLAGTDADGFSEIANDTNNTLGIPDSEASAAANAAYVGDIEVHDNWAEADQAAMAALDHDIFGTDMEASMEEDIVGVVDGVSRRNPQWTENDVKQQTSNPTANIRQDDVPNPGLLTSAESGQNAYPAPENSPWADFPRGFSKRPAGEEAASFFKFTGGPFPSLFSTDRASDAPQADTNSDSDAIAIADETDDAETVDQTSTAVADTDIDARVDADADNSEITD